MLLSPLRSLSTDSFRDRDLLCLESRLPSERERPTEPLLPRDRDPDDPTRPVPLERDRPRSTLDEPDRLRTLSFDERVLGVAMREVPPRVRVRLVPTRLLPFLERNPYRRSGSRAPTLLNPKPLLP